MKLIMLCLLSTLTSALAFADGNENIVIRQYRLNMKKSDISSKFATADLNLINKIEDSFYQSGWGELTAKKDQQENLDVRFLLNYYPSKPQNKTYMHYNWDIEPSNTDDITSANAQCQRISDVLSNLAGADESGLALKSSCSEDAVYADNKKMHRVRLGFRVSILENPKACDCPK